MGPGSTPCCLCEDSDRACGDCDDTRVFDERVSARGLSVSVLPKNTTSQAVDALRQPSITGQTDEGAPSRAGSTSVRPASSLMSIMIVPSTRLGPEFGKVTSG